MDVKRLLAFIKRWLVVLVAATVGAGVVGYAATRIQRPTREVEAQVLVGPTSGPLDLLRAASSVAQTYVELASSTQVLQAAARRTDKPIEPSAFRKRLRVRANELTRILSIQVTGKDSRESAALANALATQLIEGSKPPAPTPTPAPTPPPADAKKKQTTTQSSNGEQGPAVLTLSLVEPASPFAASSTATPLVLVLLAATIGLGTSTLAAGVIEVLRDRARDVEDVVEITGADCVTVPVGRRRAQLEERVRTASGATHVVAALPDASDETPPARIIALCSPSDAEENVDVALGLAATLGAAGQETVLVDVEPARKLTRALGLGGAAGIDSLAQTSEVAVDSVRTAIGLPGVSVVPGGSGPVPNTDGAAKILQRLINEVDRVILVTGSPRHNAVSLQWTRAADVSLLVATSGRSKRSDLEEAAHSLRLAGTKLAGTVLRVSGRHVG